MKKEHMQVLHDELIKIDLIQFFKSRIKKSIIGLLIILPILIILVCFAPEVFSFSHAAQDLRQFAVFWFSWFAVIIALVTVFYDIKMLWGIHLGKFKVEIDTLLHAVDTLESFETSGKVSRVNALAILKFHAHKDFGFSKRDIFYDWSNAYRMEGYSLLNSSAPGDKFYIVSFNGKTPIMVYNTRFFDYKEAQE